MCRVSRDGWYLRARLQVALGVENSTRDREVMYSTEPSVHEGDTRLPSFLTGDATAPAPRDWEAQISCNHPSWPIPSRSKESGSHWLSHSGYRDPNLLPS